MTPAELAEAGTVLWGEGWRRRMPEELGVNHATVWKWEAGKHPIPEIAARFLGHLLASRQGISRLAANECRHEHWHPFTVMVSGTADAMKQVLTARCRDCGKMFTPKP